MLHSMLESSKKLGGIGGTVRGLLQAGEEVNVLNGLRKGPGRTAGRGNSQHRGPGKGVSGVGSRAAVGSSGLLSQARSLDHQLWENRRDSLGTQGCLVTVTVY